MKMKSKFIIPIISTVLIAAGQAQIPSPTQTQTQITAETQPLIVPAAVAVLHPAGTNRVEGTVYFVQMNGTVTIIADIRGLEPNSVHGLHIHKYGDCTAPDATSAGKHYSPQGHKHGAPTDPEHHAGDLGNIKADADGTVRFETAVDFISVAGPENPVLGRAVLVHAKPDDLKSQPTGGSGDCLACGVIGIINPDYLSNQTNTVGNPSQKNASTNLPLNP